MASPTDAVCADIESHIKSLLFPVSNDQSTPKKSEQKNKKCDNRFPQSTPGRGPRPSPGHHQNIATPEKLPQNTPPSGATSNIQPSNPIPEVNGYDYFQGKEIVTFKPKTAASNSSTSETKLDNVSDNASKVENSNEPLDNAVGRQNNPKQKKRAKKKKEKKDQVKKEEQEQQRPQQQQQQPQQQQQEQPKVEPISVLSKQQPDDRDQRRNRNRPKGKEVDYDTVKQRLIQEIMKEKQRLNEQGWRNQPHHVSLEERLARVDPKLKKFLETEWLFPH